jgi:uncharacterized RDD family membrane protein YckC
MSERIAENTVAVEALGTSDCAEEISIAAPEASPEIPARDWREEIAAKMQDYRTRRKPRLPKYPSLQLPFDAPRSSLALELALDPSIGEWSSPAEPVDAPWLLPEPEETAAPVEAVPAATNLIEFPRSASGVYDRDELAEALIEYPRILDAPELVPPQPALGGILLDAPEDAGPAATADALLQPASIACRFLAALVDLGFVGLATVLWGWIFLRLTHAVPPLPEFLISAAVVPAILWLGYQYLLLVGAGGTLGMRALGLELSGFDGSSPEKKLRHWRWLASLLSAASLMLGYAWALLDESGLCWHDRISRTYLRRKP